MSRPLKLLAGFLLVVPLCCVLWIQYRDATKPIAGEPAEVAQAGRVATGPADETPRPSGEETSQVNPGAEIGLQPGAGREYQWIEDPNIKGGIRVIMTENDREVGFSGAHLLARLAEGTSEQQARKWLEYAGIGKIVESRDRLLKIAPQTEDIETFLQLKALLEDAPAGLFGFVEPDYIYQTMLVPDDPGLDTYGAWYFEEINAYQAWDVRSAAPDVIVAVIDTGIVYQNEEFNGNIWQNGSQVGYDFVNGDNDPNDDSGHGTAVAGIIGAKGNNGSKLAGIAWSVQLMPLKVMDNYGYGLSSDITAAITWATDRGADIINLSLGGPGRSQAMESAIVAAGQAGVAVVCAAGNAGNEMALVPDYPAAYDYPHVVQVGSTDIDQSPSAFSNYDDQLVDLFAPGGNVEVLWPAGGNFLSTISADGTSFSAPMVAGALALIISEFPGESVIDSIDRLLDGAKYIPKLESFSRRSSILNLHRSLTNYRPGPPSVSWEVNPVSIEFGDYYSLKPAIEADSKYTVSWKFNDNPLPADGADFLVFDPILFENAGTYSVTVESGEGVTVSEPVILEGIPVPPEITFVSPSLSALPGTEISLRVGLRSNWNVVVDWYEVGKEEPILTDNRRLTINVYESAAYYAHIKGPYGETTTNTIEVTLQTLNWLDNLNSTGEELPVPLGSRLNSELALVPAYWDIMVSPKELLPSSYETGLYRWNTESGEIRVEHIDLLGTLHTSEPIPAEITRPFKVLNGFVTFPQDPVMTEVLDPDLRRLPGSRGGMELIVIDESRGWFYEIYREPGTGKIGFRRTQDFYDYEVLIEELPEPSETYSAYRLWMGEGVGVLGFHVRHFWFPESGLGETLPGGILFSHEDTLYKGTFVSSKLQIYRFDTVQESWIFHAPGTEETMITLGQRDAAREYTENGYRIKEVWDGSNWIPMIIPLAGDENDMIAGTDSYFYKHRDQSENLNVAFSHDGFHWSDSSFATVHPNLAVTAGDYLVFPEGGEAVWLRENDITRKPFVFTNSDAPTQWGQVSKLNNAYFFSETGRDVFISFDMETLSLTNLRLMPSRFKQIPDGTYEAVLSQYGTSILFRSTDGITWERDDSTTVEYSGPELYFSLGVIRGNQFSEDGETWITMPYYFESIHESRNRIFFFTTSGNFYFDKTSSFDGRQLVRTVPYIFDMPRAIPGESVEFTVDWVGLFPEEFSDFKVYLDDEWIGSAAALPATFSLTVNDYRARDLSCEIDYADGPKRIFKLATVSPDFFSRRIDSASRYLDPTNWIDWEDGWISLYNGQFIQSADAENWQTATTISLPGSNLIRLRRVGPNWLAWDYNIRTVLHVSSDGGTTWQQITEGPAASIVMVVDQEVAISDDSGSYRYSTDLLTWRDLSSFSPVYQPVVYDGFLFYYDWSLQLHRLNLGTGSTIMLDPFPVALGPNAYLTKASGPALDVHALPDGKVIGRIPLRDDRWTYPDDVRFLCLKNNHYVLLDREERYTGSIINGQFPYIDSVNPDLEQAPSRISPYIGPKGLKIQKFNSIEWTYTDHPVTRVDCDLINADIITLGTDEGMKFRLEWIDPFSGEVLHTLETRTETILFPGNATNFILEFPGPDFSSNRLMDARLSLLPDGLDGLRGISSKTKTDIHVQGIADLELQLNGNGIIQFSKPGPYEVGTTVDLVAAPRDGFSFGHWMHPTVSSDPLQSIDLRQLNNLEVIFLPHGVAAIDRWSRLSFEGMSRWYHDSASQDIFLSDTGWAYSSRTGWLITTALGELLYNWSPEFGWTCTRTDWFPYHWSYQLQDWVVFNEISNAG